MTPFTVGSIVHDYRRLNVGDTHPKTGYVVTQEDVDDYDVLRLLNMADAMEHDAKRLRTIAQELKQSIYARRLEQQP